MNVKKRTTITSIISKRSYWTKNSFPSLKNSIAYVMKATIRWIRRQFFLP